MGQFGIGQPVPREEDPYLLRGEGRYCDDLRVTGLARAVVLRSPHPHARIRSIDAAAARDAAGRAAGPHRRGHGSRRRSAGKARACRGSAATASPGFISAAAAARARAGALCRRMRGLGRGRDDRPGQGRRRADRGRLRAAARHHRDRQPRSSPARSRCGTTAPTTRPSFHEVGNKAAVEAAFAKAAHVVTHRMVINRITTNSMEPRGCLADYDTRDDRYASAAPCRRRTASARHLRRACSRCRKPRCASSATMWAAASA